MHHVMFDIDGTLVQSSSFEADCYLGAIMGVIGKPLDTNWHKYNHVTDSGILFSHLDELGLTEQKDELLCAVKSDFVRRVKTHIETYGIEQIPGAAEFMGALQQLPNVQLSIATGGWLESAKLKLAAAGIDVSGIPIASSSDHYSRTEIMKIAKKSAAKKSDYACTYFGDAEWDKKACEELGFNLVLVGGASFHHQHIQDFNERDRARGYIGLQ